MALKHLDDVMNMLDNEQVTPKERIIRFLFFLKGLDNVPVTSYGSTYIAHMDYIRLTSTVRYHVQAGEYEMLCYLMGVELIEYGEEILQCRTRSAMISALEEIA